MNGWHPDKYNVFIMPTADGCWSYMVSFGIHPTICYGDVTRAEVAFIDVLWGAMVLAWKHSADGDVPKKRGALPGLGSPVCEKTESAKNEEGDRRRWIELNCDIHQGYVCSKCAAHHVKLWRQYQTFAENIELMCQVCTEENQGKTLKPGYDQIGWMVPAVPTEDGTFWGYTSVPQVGVEWWKALPEKQQSKVE